MNIYIGLQKVSTESIVKKDCGLEGIESYLYIRIKMDFEENYFTVNVSRDILNRVNLTEAEAWKQAEVNTNAETKLKSMAKMMSEILGFKYFEEIEKEMPMPLFILTNRIAMKGASAILNKKVLSKLSKKYHTNKIVALPSSIHEMILAPYTERVDLEEFSEMVKEVNHTEVDPIDRLTDRAYIITI